MEPLILSGFTALKKKKKEKKRHCNSSSTSLTLLDSAVSVKSDFGA